MPKTERDEVEAPAASGGVKSSSVLEIDDLSIEFRERGRWIPVVDQLSLEVAPGEAVGLVGESGCGKTVTSLALMRLLPPSGRLSGGSVLLGGRDLVLMGNRELNTVRAREIAMIFQEPMTALNPVLRVGEQIAEKVRRHLGLGRKDAWSRAVEMLDRVGIPFAADRARDYPHTFSGGMRQRAMIAMALSCEPKMLIADEPTTALDVTVQAEILELLRGLQQDFDMAMIFVSHDLGVIAEICDRVAVMYAGQLVEVAAVRELFERPRHPYTEALLRARPAEGPPSEKLFVIAGAPPMVGTYSDGCRFHPRCAYVRAPDCTTHDLELQQRDGRATRCVRTDDLQLGGS